MMRLKRQSNESCSSLLASSVSTLALSSRRNVFLKRCHSSHIWLLWSGIRVHIRRHTDSPERRLTVFDLPACHRENGRTRAEKEDTGREDTGLPPCLHAADAHIESFPLSRLIKLDTFCDSVSPSKLAKYMEPWSTFQCRHRRKIGLGWWAW